MCYRECGCCEVCCSLSSTEMEVGGKKLCDSEILRFCVCVCVCVVACGKVNFADLGLKINTKNKREDKLGLGLELEGKG